MRLVGAVLYSKLELTHLRQALPHANIQVLPSL